MEQSVRTLNEAEAKLESFHDCHVRGLSWRQDRFTFTVNLQYILKWIAPNDSVSHYRFSIADAQLIFENVVDLAISMSWSNAALDAQIDTITVTDTRTTPNGRMQERHFEIAFAEPDATISLWSTGYEVRLLDEPVLSAVTSIPARD
jgi:hypothetical protein